METTDAAKQPQSVPRVAGGTVPGSQHSRIGGTLAPDPVNVPKRKTPKESSSGGKLRPLSRNQQTSPNAKKAPEGLLVRRRCASRAPWGPHSASGKLSVILAGLGTREMGLKGSDD